MIPAEVPVAPPIRSGKQHVTRTVVLLTIITAVLATTLSWALAMDSRNYVVIPDSVVHPTWYVEHNPTPQGTVPPTLDGMASTGRRR